MADDDQGDALAALWTVKLEGVQRLDADDPDDHEDTYMVDLTLESPGMNGSVSVMIPGSFDDTTVVARAREALQAGLVRWARVMASHPSASYADPTQG